MREALSGRVYYTRPSPLPAITLVLLAIAAAVSLSTSSVSAQTGAPFTIDPAMTKGPADAPVTIVEFSDYQ